MARRGKKKSVNGDDLTSDESALIGDEVHDPSDDVTYTMGDIKVDDGDGDVEAEEFKKTAETMSKDSDVDGEEDDWAENYNTKDEDIFLDMADDFDIDNPYSDDY